MFTNLTPAFYSCLGLNMAKPIWDHRCVSTQASVGLKCSGDAQKTLQFTTVFTCFKKCFFSTLHSCFSCSNPSDLSAGAATVLRLLCPVELACTRNLSEGQRKLVFSASVGTCRPSESDSTDVMSVNWPRRQVQLSNTFQHFSGARQNYVPPVPGMLMQMLPLRMDATPSTKHRWSRRQGEKYPSSLVVDNNDKNNDVIIW